jgi:hypothetical protein
MKGSNHSVLRTDFMRQRNIWLTAVTLQQILRFPYVFQGKTDLMTFTLTRFNKERGGSSGTRGISL